MLSKLTTGRILLNEELKAKLITDKIIGSIEKVVIKYGKDCNEGMNVQVITSDGETLVNYDGNKDCVLYPRNWNVGSQKYVGQNIAPEGGGGVLNAAKWVSFGSLIIIFIGQSKEDYIEDLKIIIEGTIESESIDTSDTSGVNKILENVTKDAPVTSNTSGVYNPMHRRRRSINEYMKKVMKEILKEEKIEFSIEKQEPGDMADFVTDSLYGKKFEGMSGTVSDRIKEYMVRALRKGYPMNQIMNYVKRTGKTDIRQAENIARTETQALQNKVREWAYKTVDPEGQLKYKWLSIPDHRRTSICKNITNRTSNGVTIDELKTIIKEESIKGGFDGSREFTPHTNCRSSWIRHFE